MITVIKAYGFVNSKKKRLSMVGLSSEKPIGQVEGITLADGSTFIEVDTGKGYIYNESGQSWTLRYSNESGKIIYDLDGDGIDDTVATQEDIDNITDNIWNESQDDDLEG